MENSHHTSADHGRPQVPAAQLQRGGLSLADNRSSATAQRKEVNRFYGLLPVQRVVNNSIVQFVNDGNSGKLARARFSEGGGQKVKGVSFKLWKKGREAQHLIPAQICQEFMIPETWTNSSANGMMMPSGRDTTNHLRMTHLDKGKRHHIKGAGSHPRYNNKVRAFAVKRKWKPGQVTKQQFLALARILRVKNRPRRAGKARGFVDDIE